MRALAPLGMGLASCTAPRQTESGREVWGPGVPRVARARAPLEWDPEHRVPGSSKRKGDCVQP